MKKFTADAIVLTGKVSDPYLLLVRRKYPPYQGQWAFPGGFLEKDEEPYQAALRELQEETSLILEKSTPHTALTKREKIGRDPRGETVSYPFLFWIDKQEEIVANDDADEAQWIKVSSIKELSFDHGAILCEALATLWQGMLLESKEIIKQAGQAIYDLGSKDELIFYGGSFNPIHKGHHACLKLCKESFNSEISGSDIIIIPDYNPHKDAPQWPCFWQYCKEVEKEFSYLELPIFPGFCGIEDANPTYGWIKRLREKYPDKTLSILLGEDSFEALPLWNQAKKLISILDKIYLTPRQGSSNKMQEVERWIKNVGSSMKIIKLGDHLYRDLSSSAIRKAKNSKTDD